jgi:hypothetical protein
MFCLCGFSSCFGSVIANHLVSCNKWTCSANRPLIESDTVGEGERKRRSPERDIPSLFGALGLVKKSRRQHTKAILATSPEVTAHSVALDIIDDILDLMFPAEKAASDFLYELIDRVDKVICPKVPRGRRKRYRGSPSRAVSSGTTPTELKGSRKWSTVRISDTTSPSKSSIFLGCEIEMQKSDVGVKENAVKPEQDREDGFSVGSLESDNASDAMDVMGVVNGLLQALSNDGDDAADAAADSAATGQKSDQEREAKLVAQSMQLPRSEATLNIESDNVTASQAAKYAEVMEPSTTDDVKPLIEEDRHAADDLRNVLMNVDDVHWTEEPLEGSVTKEQTTVSDTVVAELGKSVDEEWTSASETVYRSDTDTPNEHATVSDDIGGAVVDNSAIEASHDDCEQLNATDDKYGDKTVAAMKQPDEDGGIIDDHQTETPFDEGSVLPTITDYEATNSRTLMLGSVTETHVPAMESVISSAEGDVVTVAEATDGETTEVGCSEDGKETDFAVDTNLEDAAFNTNVQQEWFTAEEDGAVATTASLGDLKDMEVAVGSEDVDEVMEATVGFVNNDNDDVVGLDPMAEEAQGGEVETIGLSGIASESAEFDAEIQETDSSDVYLETEQNYEYVDLQENVDDSETGAVTCEERGVTSDINDVMDAESSAVILDSNTMTDYLSDVVPTETSAVSNICEAVAECEEFIDMEPSINEPCGAGISDGYEAVAECEEFVDTEPGFDEPYDAGDGAEVAAESDEFVDVEPGNEEPHDVGQQQAADSNEESARVDEGRYMEQPLTDAASDCEQPSLVESNVLASSSLCDVELGTAYEYGSVTGYTVDDVAGVETEGLVKQSAIPFSTDSEHADLSHQLSLDNRELAESLESAVGETDLTATSAKEPPSLLPSHVTACRVETNELSDVGAVCESERRMTRVESGVSDQVTPLPAPRHEAVVTPRLSRDATTSREKPPTYRAAMDWPTPTSDQKGSTSQVTDARPSTTSSTYTERRDYGQKDHASSSYRRNEIQARGGSREDSRNYDRQRDHYNSNSYRGYNRRGDPRNYDQFAQNHRDRYEGQQDYRQNNSRGNYRYGHRGDNHHRSDYYWSDRR